MKIKNKRRKEIENKKEENKLDIENIKRIIIN